MVNLAQQLKDWGSSIPLNLSEVAGTVRKKVQEKLIFIALYITKFFFSFLSRDQIMRECFTYCVYPF